MTTESIQSTQVTLDPAWDVPRGIEEEALSEPNEQSSQTGRSVRTLCEWTSTVFESSAPFEVSRNGHHGDHLLEKRYREARASAVMDPDCLFLLDRLGETRYFETTKLEGLISQTTGWLKLCLLVRADLVEIAGSTVRITDEGRRELTELARIADHESG